MTGDDALVRTVARLAEEGIAVTELSLRLPSLDEVFYALTGHAGSSDETSALETEGAHS